MFAAATLEPRPFVFFHADRARTLTEGQSIELDNRGLSQMGRTYWSKFLGRDYASMSDAEKRESHLERVRTDFFHERRASRMTAICAALTFDDAVRHALSTEPIPEYEIPIFEIIGNEFATYDRNWMDSSDFPSINDIYAKSYWYGEITNHSPSVGERRPPMLEVLVQLPARVGKQVGVAKR
jgi:hypothetical protein